jgi:hypothetical protein
MATTYSPNLALTLQGTNDNPGTWGNITNTNLGTLIEQAISGYEVQSLTAGTTLTLTIPNGASGVARNMYLEFTGAGSTVIVPSNKKLYFVYNNCSSGTVTMKVAGQTGVTIANGAKQILVSNGTDIEEAISPGLEGITTVAMTAYGVDAGDSVTSGANNTAIGYNAGTAVTSGTSNTFLGYEAGLQITTSNFNTHIGYSAGSNGGNVSSNTFVGYLNGYNIGGGSNVSVGGSTLQGAGPANTAANNTAIGFQALQIILSGSGNSAIGYRAGYSSVSTYSNTTCVGNTSEVTGSDQVQLGNSSTTTYAYGSVQNRSDQRDKTDIQNSNLGLDFVMQLQPRMFRWDMREDYRPSAPGPNATPEEIAAWQEACKLANITHDGTHKRTRYHYGLIAQEVKQTMDAMGVDFGGYQDHTIKGGDAVVSLGYEELIAPLIKAIQELKAEFDEYKRTHP